MSLAPCDLFELMPGDTFNFGGLDDGPLGDTDLDLVAGTGAVNSNGGDMCHWHCYSVDPYLWLAFPTG